MRLALLALSLSFMACGGGSTPEKDLSMAVDMTAPTGDMAKDTCFQLLICGQGCSGSTTCEAGCAAKGTATAVQLYNALFGCAYGACTTAEDGGTAACASNTDSSAGCFACVASAAQSQTCATQLTTCENSTS